MDVSLEGIIEAMPIELLQDTLTPGGAGGL